MEESDGVISIISKCYKDKYKRNYETLCVINTSNKMLCRKRSFTDSNDMFEENLMVKNYKVISLAIG